MKPSLYTLATLSLLVAISLVRPVAAQSFHDIGVTANTSSSEATDVNADGSVVVGTSRHVFPQSPPYISRAVRWTLSGGLRELPLYSAAAHSSGGRISSLGNAASGISDPFIGSNGSGAFLWTLSSGTARVRVNGYTMLQITGLSATGAYVSGGYYGDYQGISNNHAVRVNGSTFEVLPVLIARTGAFATDMTPDGAVIVGQTSSRAVRWQYNGGWTVQDLGTVRAGSATYANAVSADGNTVIGDDVLSNRRAFRWTVTGGMQGLGAPAGVSDIRAAGVSGDGSWIVANGTGTQGDRALIWRSGVGWADLTTYATSLNIPVGTRVLRYARSISEDGNAIVGQDSMGRGYVLYLGPEPVHNSASFSAFGTGCSGPAGVPRLAAEQGSLPWLGSVFTPVLDNLGGGLPLLILGASRSNWGSTPLPFDLTLLGMPNCFLYTDPVLVVALTNVAGVARWTVPIPAMASYAGITLYAQGAVTINGANAANLLTSNACEMRLGW